MTTGFNFADIWEAAAEAAPDDLATIHGESMASWREFDRRADAVASVLLKSLERQDPVALLLRNSPAYLEALFAALKASMVPVNTNYRYGSKELSHLWNDAGAAAVVFGDEFTDACGVARPALPKVQLWLHVGPVSDCPDWAVSYSEMLEGRAGRVRASRSGDDIIMQYTGGTTGYPKGVLWRQDDLFRMLESANGSRLTDGMSPQEFLASVRGRGVRVLPAAPLMHGTAAWFSMPALSRAGTVVTLKGKSFDPIELLDTIVAKRVKSTAVVGDVFVKPMLAALDAEPHRWDLSGLRVVFSSGVMFSSETKMRLMKYAPNALIVDNLGSQESGATGLSTVKSGDPAETGRFRPAPGTRVIDEDGRAVRPGSGERGRVAISGYLPLGYHNDPAKTARTFIVLDGRRFVVPGDWAEVLADGSIRLLGRGSECINTGGEKVYPEEVEEVLKTIVGVADAAVVGVPDERFGEAVVALIQRDASSATTANEIRERAREHLAGYKLPKRVISVENLDRAANGKLNYPALRQLAAAAIASRGADDVR